MENMISDDQYKNQISTDQITILKFYTTWCPDCKNMDRFIGNIVEKNSDKVWLEVDTEKYQHIAEENEVRGIPSLIVYHLHSKFAKTPEQIEEFIAGIS